MTEKGTPFHNSFRSYMYTPKGKRIGCEEKWRSFHNFKKDMKDSYFEGAVLRRKNPLMPFSKENCEWVKKGEEGANRPNIIKIEYNGEVKTINEWAYENGLSAYGIKLRYFRSNGKLSAEEIIFGIKAKPLKVMKDANGLTESGKKSKASKMISSYFCRDKKRDLHHYQKPSNEWFVKNIFNSKCEYCGGTDMIGADRIDNTKGHSIDNIVPCCYRCNVIKNTFFTKEEMKLIGKFCKDIIDKRL